MNNWPNNHWSECRRATSVGNADPWAARVAQFTVGQTRQARSFAEWV